VLSPIVGSDIDEDITSSTASGDESEVSFCKEPQPSNRRKRKTKVVVSGPNDIAGPVQKRPKIGGKKKIQKGAVKNVGGSKTFTVDGVLSAFAPTTEYGCTFRALADDDQKLEVTRLNKGAASGMKGAIRKMRIDVQYKDLVSEKMKAFIVSSRTEQGSMFRAIPKSRVMQSMQIKFLSVGEWVEVQGDISPGWNSEGGIGVITRVTDGLADVKYVLTRWVEKLVPLRRLTTIIMPHRAAYAALRIPTPLVAPASKDTGVSQLRTMSSIQLLKYGIEKKIYRTKGWLLKLLVKEGGNLNVFAAYYFHNCMTLSYFFSGLMNDTKESKKERCWADYKSQQLYIEAMREAKEDPEYDPRRTHLVTGKDGRFQTIGKSKTIVPRNPLTVQYLCHALAIPYATFKRWKADAFQCKAFVPEHKGKTVLTCANWATKIYNARRMYWEHHMTMWLEKNPHRKHDSEAKKVRFVDMIHEWFICC
jgi:hypothetical protein